MRRVCWISRHPLPPEALKDLQSRFGEVEVETKNLLFSSDGEEALSQLREAAAGYTAVGFVSPAQLTAALLRAAKDGRGLGISGFFVISVPRMAEDGKTRIFAFDHVEFFEL